jgi:hypothetical protein
VCATLKQMQRHHEQHDANSEEGDPEPVPKIHDSAPAASEERLGGTGYAITAITINANRTIIAACGPERKLRR